MSSKSSFFILLGSSSVRRNDLNYEQESGIQQIWLCSNQSRHAIKGVRLVDRFGKDKTLLIIFSFETNRTIFHLGRYKRYLYKMATQINITNKRSIIIMRNIINILTIINIISKRNKIKKINKLNKRDIQTIRNIQDIQSIQSIVC